MVITWLRLDFGLELGFGLVDIITARMDDYEKSHQQRRRILGYFYNVSIRTF